MTMNTDDHGNVWIEEGFPEIGASLYPATCMDHNQCLTHKSLKAMECIYIYI